jgi:hypothetical protein
VSLATKTIAENLGLAPDSSVLSNLSGDVQRIMARSLSRNPAAVSSHRSSGSGAAPGGAAPSRSLQPSTSTLLRGGGGSTRALNAGGGRPPSLGYSPVLRCPSVDHTDSGSGPSHLASESGGSPRPFRWPSCSGIGAAGAGGRLSSSGEAGGRLPGSSALTSSRTPASSALAAAVVARHVKNGLGGGNLPLDCPPGPSPCSPRQGVSSLPLDDLSKAGGSSPTCPSSPLSPKPSPRPPSSRSLHINLGLVSSSARDGNDGNQVSPAHNSYLRSGGSEALLQASVAARRSHGGTPTGSLDQSVSSRGRPTMGRDGSRKHSADLGSAPTSPLGVSPGSGGASPRIFSGRPQHHALLESPRQFEIVLTPRSASKLGRSAAQTAGQF